MKQNIIIKSNYRGYFNSTSYNNSYTNYISSNNTRIRVWRE